MKTAVLSYLLPSSSWAVSMYMYMYNTASAASDADNALHGVIPGGPLRDVIEERHDRNSASFFLQTNPRKRGLAVIIVLTFCFTECQNGQRFYALWATGYVKLASLFFHFFNFPICCWTKGQQKRMRLRTAVLLVLHTSAVRSRRKRSQRPP